MTAANTGQDVGHELAKEALAAVAVLALAVVQVFLPVVAVPWFDDIVTALREPAAGAVVAVTVFALSRWRYRIAVSVAALLAVLVAVQVGAFQYTTRQWRAAERAAAEWRTVPVADAAAGLAENEDSVFGSAQLRWHDDTIDLRLRSKIGTTQQGFYMQAGDPDGSYLFSALVSGVVGAPTSTCPLLFGISNTRTYHTFRIQRTNEGDPIAYVYRIEPNDPKVLTSGFHGTTLASQTFLPYFHRYNILRPWEADKVRLAIYARGSRYQFFINDRLVASKELYEGAPHTVAVGVTVLNRGGFDDTDCHFEQVRLRAS